jgi:Na+-driven multidrug efflux pump
MLWISAIFLIPFVLLNMVFGFEIVRLVAQTDALAMASVPTLYVITAALGFFVVANIFFSVVSGSGNTKVSLWMEISTLVIYLVMSYWLGIVMNAKVHWIWLTEVVYFIFLGLLSALYLKYSNWSDTKF